MSEQTTIVCPTCRGSGELLAMFCKYAEGHSGPLHRSIACDRCHGTKTVPAAMADWIILGKEIRAWRLAQDIGLSQVETQLGVDVVTWCHLENGRVDNSNWQQLLKVHNES